MTDRVRIGCLGAARITPLALVKPAQEVAAAEVVAVAARDRERAQAFASKHGIARVHDSYQALVEDPDVDAIYNPLPNSLHAKWTLAALEAGKHVLCEKPFAANAAEAERVEAAAAATDRVVMEAFHWRYHPLAARVLEIRDSGQLGAIRHVETSLCFPLVKPGDIRWQRDLAGGAVMDAGCYAIHMLRTFGGSEPTVTRARAKLRSPGVDRYVQADFSFADGATGRITTSMLSARLVSVGARLEGEQGSVRVLNPVMPQMFHILTVKAGGRTRRERVRGATTYGRQLEAFVAAVLRGEPTLTPPAESVANMRVIDAVYRAAGMQPRRGATDEGGAPAER